MCRPLMSHRLIFAFLIVSLSPCTRAWSLDDRPLSPNRMFRGGLTSVSELEEAQAELVEAATQPEEKGMLHFQVAETFMKTDFQEYASEVEKYLRLAKSYPIPLDKKLLCYSWIGDAYVLRIRPKEDREAAAASLLECASFCFAGIKTAMDAGLPQETPEPPDFSELSIVYNVYPITKEIEEKLAARKELFEKKRQYTSVCSSIRIRDALERRIARIYSRLAAPEVSLRDLAMTVLKDEARAAGVVARIETDMKQLRAGDIRGRS